MSPNTTSMGDIIMFRLKKRIFAALLCAALALSGCAAPTGGEAVGPRESTARSDMKAVWVSSVYNLDYPTQPTADSATLKKEADKVLANAVEMGMNTVFLQVRPTADAFYPSEIFPWSAWLTGNQATAPKNQFDPLEYWIDQAHALGLELHAWINPYRVTRSGQKEFDALSDKSPAKQHPEWVVKHTAGGQDNYYLDPGIPEVRELVIKGAEEIVRNYDVDGIHLDDYFYPDDDFADAATFETYGRGFTDLGDWRRDNVNLLVKELDSRLHAIKPGLSYGISPSGIWRDKKNDSLGSATTAGYESYVASYADSRKWVKEGWIDYICPQVYWPIGHRTSDYSTIVKWWADTVRGTGVKLYIGMADYQAGEAGWNGVQALREQLALNKTVPEVSGEAHFRYQFLVKNQDLKNLYMSEYAGVDVGPDAESLAWLSGLHKAEQTHWAAKYYGKLGAMGIVTGRDDGSYSPDESMTRGSMSKLIFSSMKELNGTVLGAHIYDNPVPDTAGSWSEHFVVPLFHAGYLEVRDYPTGFFQEKPMSRLEVVKLLVRALGYKDDGSVTSTKFQDVTKDHYYVAKATELGIVTGNTDGTFTPNADVTRATAAAMLLRAIN